MQIRKIFANANFNNEALRPVNIICSRSNFSQTGKDERNYDMYQIGFNWDGNVVERIQCGAPVYLFIDDENDTGTFHRLTLQTAQGGPGQGDRLVLGFDDIINVRVYAVIYEMVE